MDEKFKKEDQLFLENRTKLADKLDMPDLWNVIDQFPLFTGIQTLGKTFAVYKIKKKYY